MVKINKILQSLIKGMVVGRNRVAINLVVIKGVLRLEFRFFGHRIINLK